MAVKSPGRDTLAWQTGGWSLGRRAARRIGRGFTPIVLVAAVVAVWWVITVVLGHRSRVLPSPLDVAAQLARMSTGETPLGSAYLHLAATFARLVVAFCISFVVGASVGILAGRRRMVFDLLSNVVWVLLAIPSVVWVFVFAVAIGLGNAVPVAAICALLTPLVLINVVEGTKSIPADLTEMATAFHVRRWQLVRDVFVPYLAPYLAGAARVSFALGVRIVMVAEVIGLSRGAGYLVNYWNQSVEVAPIVAWGIVFIVLGVAIDRGVFAPLERSLAKGRAVQETRSEVV